MSRVLWWRRLAWVAVLAVLAVVLNTSSAGADADGSYELDPDAPPTGTEIAVESGPSGVTIYIGLVAVAPGTDGSPGSDHPVAGDGGPDCSAMPMNIGNASLQWLREGLDANPDTVPWWVLCDSGYAGVAWVPTDAPAAPDVVVGAPPTPAVDPEAVAASVLGIVPLPPIEVRANPEVGLVAVPSWFWLEGYDGSTLTGSRTLGNITIDVEITPTSYGWSFGDGASLQTVSLGRPYPQESDLRHTYEQSSLGAGGTFEVQVDITFDARYRVNGGAWLPLDPVVQSFTRDYAVQQLQSVLTSSR